MPLPDLRPKSGRTPTSARYQDLSSSVNQGGGGRERNGGGSVGMGTGVESSSYRDIIREKLNNSSRNIRNDSRQSIDLSLNAENVSRPQSRISFNQEINSINNDFNNRLSDRHQTSNNNNNTSSNQRREISSNRNRQVIFYNRTYVPSASDTNNETKTDNAPQDYNETNTSTNNAKSRRNERLNESLREQSQITQSRNSNNNTNHNNDGLARSRSSYLSSSPMSKTGHHADENADDYEQANAQFPNPNNTSYNNRQKSTLLKNDQTDFNSYLRASSKRNKSSSNRFSLNIDHFAMNDNNNNNNTNNNKHDNNIIIIINNNTMNNNNNNNNDTNKIILLLIIIINYNSIMDREETEVTVHSLLTRVRGLQQS